MLLYYLKRKKNNKRVVLLLAFCLLYKMSFRVLTSQTQNLIVGAGPCGGLTIAFYLSSLGEKCLVLDREKKIGGLHRVRRVSRNELWTEHGPHIYLSSFCQSRKTFGANHTR